MKSIPRNSHVRMDGLTLLRSLRADRYSLAFFDPQYRALLDKMKFGNEGARQGARKKLPHMSDALIRDFVTEYERVLAPSGHLMLWVDKFTLCEKHYRHWLVKGSLLRRVDMIAWNKRRMGMGRRARAVTEFLVIFQKEPVRAKGCWTRHDIRDSWAEAVRRDHPHEKPIKLQRRLIEATTKPGAIVLDAAAGSYSVMTAAHACGRNFLGCDIKFGKAIA